MGRGGISGAPEATTGGVAIAISSTASFKTHNSVLSYAAGGGKISLSAKKKNTFRRLQKCRKCPAWSLNLSDHRHRRQQFLRVFGARFAQNLLRLSDFH